MLPDLDFTSTCKVKMHELSMFAAAAEDPARDCLIVSDRVWSYGEVAGRVASAVGALRQQGVRSEERIGLAPVADLDSALWLYAAFELGCPVVLAHPRLGAHEREELFEQTRVASVVAGPAPSEPSPLPSMDSIAPERALAIAYTSGSRGAPRGARLSRRAFVASEAAHAANLGWLPNERWLLAMPPAHVGGLSILTRSLIARRCVVLSSGPFDAAKSIELMQHHAVTLLSVVPTMLERLLRHAPAWRPHPELRAVLVGGAPWSERSRQEAVERGVPALATYGCTEACSQVATQSIEQAGTPGSGAPLPGIELRMQNGEIQVRGDVQMDGYLGDSRDTETWTPDGWLRTGDLGAFLPDGQLAVHGRRDELIITGGENVAPQEVESWLESLPGITSACVFGTPDAEWGHAVAAAVVSDEPALDPTRLRERFDEGLARFKRPKWVAVLEELPLNRSGKVDRALVAARCEGKLVAV
jgi:O-succinylbenzoic acid--CoA ligase